MAPELKFCGLTRAEDAEAAAAAGAAYAGVIFAGGPRHLSVERATDVLAGLPASVVRTGVFADQPLAAIAAAVRRVGLGVVQLHARRSAGEVATVRAETGAEVWAAIRVDGGSLPDDYERLAAAADAIVVDAFVPGQLGGTGRVADWPALAAAFATRGRPGRLVLAGGLRPENVGEAVGLLEPAVVDVSSGVERVPGIKDHERMMAFAAAVHAAARRTQTA